MGWWIVLTISVAIVGGFFVLLTAAFAEKVGWEGAIAVWLISFLIVAAVCAGAISLAELMQ